jgi:hypothetical protein
MKISGLIKAAVKTVLDRHGEVESTETTMSLPQASHVTISVNAKGIAQSEVKAFHTDVQQAMYDALATHRMIQKELASDAASVGDTASDLGA